MKIDIEFAGEVLEAAVRGGADLAEVFLRSSRNLTIEVKELEVDSIKSSAGFGYGLRIIRGGRPGFAYSTSRDDRNAIVAAALESAAYADADPALDLPGPSDYPVIETADPLIEGMFSESPDRFREEDAIERVTALEKCVLEEDRRIKKIRKASGSFTRSETALVNSKNLRGSYSSTYCSAQVTAIAEQNGESQVGWDFEGSRFLRGVSFENTGRRAARNAVRLLGSRKIGGRKGYVVLDNSVAVEFLGILGSSFSADAVQKGKSLLAGKLGSAIVAPFLGIRDSGLLPGRPGSSPMDDEGVPSAEKTVVREGVLELFLHNTYTAKKEGAVSTGNAARGSYSAPPSVGITNLFLDAPEPATVPFGTIFERIGTGLYVVDAMGIHTANVVSGDFSVGVSGIWIEKGEPQFPVKEAAISGNVLGLFRAVEAVGDDLRFFGSIGSPSLVIGGLDISG